MLHELRTYTIQPGRFGQYLRLTARVGIPIRTRHSKLVGYWTTETGELNQVVHLWEYDDHDHRARVRAALAKDRAWQTRYVARAHPMLQRQHAWILMPLDVWPFTAPTEPGIYELRDYRLQPGIERAREWLAQFRLWLQARQKYSKPVAVWQSELGELSHVIHLWHYRSLAHRAEVRDAVMQEPARLTTVATVAEHMQLLDARILVPTAFSPLR